MIAGVGGLLTDLSEALGSLGVRWYVFGAFCALAYGRPRLTADVDITVELRGMDPVALTAVLGPAGFDLRAAFDADFLRATRLVPLIHRATSIPVDLLIATTDLQRELLDRARTTEISGVRVPLMSPEDLIVTKVVAGRRKDLEDVRGVLQTQTALDWDRIRSLIAKFERALGDLRLSKRLARLR